MAEALKGSIEKMVAAAGTRVGLWPPLKAGQEAYVISGADALDLADLAGVERDLEWATAACRVVHTRVGSPSTDMTRRACIDAALMRYRRCFNQGKRTGLRDADLADFSQDEMELHDLVLFLADKSIAHCVDGDEQSLPYLLVENDPSSPKFRGQVKTCTTTTSHYNVIDAKAFEALCIRVAEVAHAKAEVLVAKIVTELTAQPAHTIRAMAPVADTIMDSEEVLRRWRVEAAKAGDKRRLGTGKSPRTK